MQKIDSFVDSRLKIDIKINIVQAEVRPVVQGKDHIEAFAGHADIDMPDAHAEPSAVVQDRFYRVLCSIAASCVQICLGQRRDGPDRSRGTSGKPAGTAPLCFRPGAEAHSPGRVRMSMGHATSDLPMVATYTGNAHFQSLFFPHRRVLQFLPAPDSIILAWNSATRECKYASFPDSSAVDGSRSCRTFIALNCSKRSPLIHKNLPCAEK